MDNNQAQKPSARNGPFLILAVLCLLVPMSCNRGPVLETKLTGYDKGKPTFRMSYLLNKAKLDDGQPGYRIEGSFHHAIGDRSNNKVERKQLVKPDFSLVRSEMTNIKNQVTIKTTARVEGSTIFIDIQEDGGEVKSHELTYEGPVYADLHPLAYFRDLPDKGMTKNYTVLDDSKAQIGKVLVKNLGLKEFFEGERAITGIHFQIQVFSLPEEFDNYYLDPKTGNIIKIQFGQIKFLPANS